MTEYSWLHGNDLGFMLSVLSKEEDSRKLGLAASACVRRIWNKLTDPRLKNAVEAAEAYADFRIRKQQIKALRSSLFAIIDETREKAIYDKAALPDWVWTNPDSAESWVLFDTVWPVEHLVRLAELILKPSRVDSATFDTIVNLVRRIVSNYSYRDDPEELATLCALLRDIFGNPLRPTSFYPSWRTDTAIALAHQMYESRDFGAMPILADALQDAGCENDDILNHCRDVKTGGGLGETAGGSLTQQVHVRGCWVVDLVLGKE